MAADLNRVTMTGNLTKDPDLHTTESGFAICTLRIASNTPRKNSSTGQWEEKPNYFDVKVFGKQGENASKYLQKGRSVAVDGRLEWREWEKDGQKRQAVEIVVDLSGTVKFLGGGGGNGAAPEPVAASGSDDDNLPF